MSATEQAERPGRKPTRADRFRDIFTFLGAWVIIGWQMFAVEPGQVNESFLILAASLLGIPFGAEAVARIRGGSGTSASEPSSPPSPSPESSSS